MRNFIPTVFPLLPAEGGGGKATPVLFIKHQQNPGAEQASSQVYFYVCPPPPHRPLPPRPLLLVHMLSSCHEALHSKCQTWSYQKKLQNSKYVWIITPVKQRTAFPPPPALWVLLSCQLRSLVISPWVYSISTDLQRKMKPLLFAIRLFFPHEGYKKTDRAGMITSSMCLCWHTATHFPAGSHKTWPVVTSGDSLQAAFTWTESFN